MSRRSPTAVRAGPRSRSSRPSATSRGRAVRRPTTPTRREHPSGSGQQLLALVLICLAPLVVIPGGENRFVFGKALLVAVGIAIAAASAPRGRLPRAVVVLVGCGLAVLTLSALTSAEPWVAVFGRAPRYEGLPMIVLYAAAAWAGARLLGPEPAPEADRALIGALGVTSVAVALVAVLQGAGVHVLASNVARPGSLLGNADDEGALGVLLLGACAWATITRWPDRRTASFWAGPAAPAVGVAGAGVIIALSASRAALVGLAATGLVLLVAAPVRRRLVVVAMVLVVVLLTLAVPSSLSRVTGSSPLAGSTASARVLLWEETAALFAHHAALGVGPDNYIDAIPAEHNARWQSQVGPANPPDAPQNVLLQALDDGGLILLAMTLALIALVVQAAWRTFRAERTGVGTATSTKIGLFAGLVGYGTALLFGLTTPGTTPLAACFAGCVLAVAPAAVGTTAGGRPEGSRRWAPSRRATQALRWSAATLAALGAIVLLLAGIAEIPLQHGLEAVAAGNVTAAEADFHDAQDLRPWDASVAQTAAHAFTVAADAAAAGSASGLALRQAAGPWLTRTATHLGSNEEERLDEASVAELSGRFAQARQLLDRALAVDPGDPAILLRLGVVEGETHHLPRARADLLAAARIDPSSAAVWRDLAIVYGLEHNPAAQAQAEAKARRLG